MKSKVKIEQISIMERVALFISSVGLTSIPLMIVRKNCNLDWFDTIIIWLSIALIVTYITATEVKSYKIIQYLKDKDEENENEIKN